MTLAALRRLSNAPAPAKAFLGLSALAPMCIAAPDRALNPVAEPLLDRRSSRPSLAIHNVPSQIPRRAPACTLQPTAKSP